MTDNSIHVGSIISLQSVDSVNAEGGYLNTLGWVTDIPVITHFHDPHVRALVTTHAQMNRSDGSGSWQILSADPEKQSGDELKSGDKIYLLNMQPGAGYLDTFEWVDRLEPFKTYYPAMQIGVFTSSVPNRGGGVSGTWTIYLTPPDATASDAKPVTVGSTIYLKNDYPGAGFLFTYADNGKQVHEHNYMQNGEKVFEQYKAAKKFVFTGQSDQQGENSASYAWKIMPIGLLESLYRVENQWGAKVGAPWHDAGIFKMSGSQNGRVVALKIPEPKEPTSALTGTVKFASNIEFSFEATAGTQPNSYTVTLKFEGTEQQETWQLGSREYQQLIYLDVKDENGILMGEIQYEGERPIRLRATPATKDDHDILYDYFHPDLLKGRTQKMQGVIDTTYRLLSDTIKAFDEIKVKMPQSTLDVDFDFQHSQLHNLQLLSTILNAFYAYKLKHLMKQSFKNHRQDQTLAPLHLVRQTFQHLATDHEIIQQATVQRRWTHGINADDYFVSEQAVELLIMDKLAIKAIAPFKHLLPHNKDENELAIISYLSDKTHIRHLPYSDQFILIGVSYDRVPQAGSLFDDKPLFERPFHAFELMAIPHEVGHYIYEHGKLADGRPFPDVGKQFEGNNPYYRWSEEIFADLYGCMVTGPLTVLSMRALLVSINRERAWKDDEHHPTPVLRIFMLNEMLRILKDICPDKYDFSDVADKLDEDWAGILESWGYGQVGQANKQQDNKRPARIYMHDNSDIHLEKIVNVDRVINAIRPIVVEFATLLLDHFDPQAQTDAAIPWAACTDPGTSKTAADKLNAYSEKMREITNRTFATEKNQGTQTLSIDIDIKKPDMANPDNPKKPYLPDELLRVYLENWGDSGPFGWGGH